MNPFQLVQQIRGELATAVWPGGGAGAFVFGARNAIIHAAGSLPNPDNHRIDFPFVLVSLGDSTSDPEDPDLLTQNVNVVVAAEVAGNRFGEFALIGGARPSTTDSRNAGVLELAPQVLRVIGDSTALAGTRIQLSAQSTVSPGMFGGNASVALQELRFQAICTQQAFYPEPQQLEVSGATWTWEGDESDARIDFLGFVLGYVAGSTPASSVASVTPVYTGTAQTTSHTPVAGRAYSIFATYGTRGVIEGSSDGSLVGTFVTT